MNLFQNLNRLYDGAFQRDIREDAQSHFEIMDNSDYVFYNISEGLKAMDELRFAIDDPGARIDFRYIPFWAKSLERYRWPTTMALQCKFFINKQFYLTPLYGGYALLLDKPIQSTAKLFLDLDSLI